MSLTVSVNFYVSLLCCDCFLCHINSYYLVAFFLICNSFLLTLTSTSIVLCALASQRQTNTVTNTPVTSDIHQTLDVQLNF